MYCQTDFIIVFGSAATWAAGKTQDPPRDIDVAFGGVNTSTADAESAARVWASQVGLPADLPVDSHRFLARESWCERVVLFGHETLLRGNTKAVYLPIPEGLTLHHVVLRGNVAGVPDVRRGLTSLLRLSEVNPELARELVLSGRKLRIGFIPGEGWGEDLDTYIGDGPEALFRALRHTSPEFLAELGELGDLLAKIRNLGATEWSRLVTDAPQELGDQGFRYPGITCWVEGGEWLATFAQSSFQPADKIHRLAELVFKGELPQVTMTWELRYVSHPKS